MVGTSTLSLLMFTVVNAAAIGFFLYVFAQFWKEGHRTGLAGRARNLRSGFHSNPGLISVGGPIDYDEQTPAEEGRVIEFPVRAGQLVERLERAEPSRGVRPAAKSAAR